MPATLTTPDASTLAEVLTRLGAVRVRAPSSYEVARHFEVRYEIGRDGEWTECVLAGSRSTNAAKGETVLVVKGTSPGREFLRRLAVELDARLDDDEEEERAIEAEYAVDHASPSP